MDSWNAIKNIADLDSPALVVYPERVRENIRRAIARVGDIGNLSPHVKTHKSPEVSKMMLDAGIRKFKCATIAEAEMLAQAGAGDILLAYQPVGPKVNRLERLLREFPKVRWSCLIDDLECARDMSYVFEKSRLVMNVLIDLNVGMNRTGISPNDAFGLADDCRRLSGIAITGLHVYDGHLRDSDFEVRRRKCDEAFDNVRRVAQDIESRLGREMKIVAGGSPTFSIHCSRKDVECSPGTFVYWDKGYETQLPEQQYLHAALVVTRVISVPGENLICIDLGHKSIASENPLQNRVHFLNAHQLQPVSHSEEHMVLRTTPEKKYRVGDVLYGVPYHICPTVALYDVSYPVVEHVVGEKWNTIARRRKIEI